MITEAPCLKYFNSSDLCQSSETVQNKVVEQHYYKRINLSVTQAEFSQAETWYAQIEKELLAIVFALDTFHLCQICDYFLWPPEVNQEIKHYIQRWQNCSEYQTANLKETLMTHDVPDRSWSKMGTVLFSMGNDNYLITAQQPTLPIFWKSIVSKIQLRTVIKKLKAYFARLGFPDQVMRDNVPQFDSTSFHHFNISPKTVILNIWQSVQVIASQTVKSNLL